MGNRVSFPGRSAKSTAEDRMNIGEIVREVEVVPVSEPMPVAEPVETPESVPALEPAHT